MNFVEFHKQWHKFGCFNINQVFSWNPHFNRMNLYNWEKKKYLIKLRKEFYAFPDYQNVPDFGYYIANRIYRPSYISLYSALSFYGMIPESVIQFTSVTSLKTSKFINQFGEFFFQSIKPELMFGYTPRNMSDGRTIFFATPEKALLDLLYLNPYYKTEEDMIELRLDESFMEDEFNKERFLEYAGKTSNKALIARVNILLNSYGL